MQKLIAVLAFAVGVSTAALAQYSPAPISNPDQALLTMPSSTVESPVERKG